MIKLIFLLVFFSTSTQAKSFKLGDMDLSRVFLKQAKICTSDDQCKTNLCQDGKCEYCSVNKPCSTGFICVQGMCTQDVLCLSNKDCPVGVCDPETARCADCVTDLDCQTGSQKGRKCENSICQNCAIDDLACGTCEQTQKPDGSGGCVCADDAFNNNGTCANLCDFTDCNTNLVASYDQNLSCCCQPCPVGTFIHNGECIKACDFTTCLNGTKTVSENMCCCR